MISFKDLEMEAVGMGYEFDPEDAIFAAECGHEWSRHTGELTAEDERDSYDPVEAYFFPPAKADERRERINAYLAREPKFTERAF